MNKKILFTALLASFALPIAALAQLQPYAPGAPHVSGIGNLLGSIEMAAGLIFGGIAVICFLVAGVLFLTANGEPEKLSKARSAVIWGFAGVIVGIAAFSIIAIVESFLT